MGGVTLSLTALAALALFCGVWLAVALFATLAANRRAASARSERSGGARAESMLAAAPFVPALVHRDGRIEAGPRLAGLIGVAELRTLDDLSAGTDGLAPDDLARLRDALTAAAAGEPLALSLAAQGSARVLRILGGPAPPPHPPGTVLAWIGDATAEEQARRRHETEAAEHRAALDALSALIEAAPFPMWYRGPDLELALVNGAYVNAVEAADAAAVIAARIELIEEIGDTSPKANAALVRDQGRTVARTLPTTVGGERRMLRVVEVPLGSGGVGGYAIDVEEREQARAELARFARAQHDMLDRLSAGVAQFSRDRSLIFSNGPFARLFSLTPDFLTENPEFDRVLEHMREAGNVPEVRNYPEWRDEKRRWFMGEFAATEEDWLLGNGRHMRVVAQPLPDGGLLLIFEDRTEQVQLASARDTLLRVRTATFDNLFEAIGVFASDGRLNLWNNRFREVWQFEEEQLASHPRIDAMVPAIGRKLKNPNHAGLVRELVRSATVERKQRSGRVSFTDGRDFEFAAVPLPDGNALFTMLDITDSRMIETALRERNEALEDADRTKTQFVSNMSYELRTPLTSIGGFAEMLGAGYAGEISGQAQDYVRAILASVERLGTLIDDVLDLTHSDSGALMLAEEEVDVAALAREAADAVAGLAERKHMRFDRDIDPSAGRITGDPRRLRQALDHILKNAFAYTPEAGRVTIAADGDADEARLTVADTGKGIAPADQARVFDRFHRSEGREGALGLGLPLARQFVEGHGGRIELVSEVGQGTTVTVRLPRTSPARK